jgi:glycerol kinase
MNVLAIDQGTSSTKALVVDGANRVAGDCTAPVRTHALGDGAVEQDPEELLESVISAGRGACEQAGQPVQAVGIANQGETVLRWDPTTGRPLGPSISWQDTLASTITHALADYAPRLEAITGLPLDPYFAAPKMTWLRRRDGDEGVVTTVDVWINHRLTGRAVTDAATASRTLLLDLDTVCWSEEALGYFGLDAAQPDLAGCAEPVGETRAFGDTVPVTGLIVDQQAALFAESCFGQGEAKCTYGTGAFLLANAGCSSPRSRAGLAACVAWRIGDATTYCLDGQVYTAGAAVSWLQRLGLVDDVSDLDRAMAASTNAPERGIFVPALVGLGAPDWAPHARAGWTGLSLASSRDDLLAAVVWGIAAQIARLGRAMAVDLGAPVAALRVDGGLSRSAGLMQAQADLLQVPVERYPHADATALGVAALARIGAGAASVADAVPRWRPEAVFEPRMSPDEAEEHLGRFAAASGALAGLSSRASTSGWC